jgi:hypothetical protein
LAVLWGISDRVYSLNLQKVSKHPEVMADHARTVLKHFGVISKPADEAFAYEFNAGQELRFWYRQASQRFQVAKFEWGNGLLDLKNGPVTMSLPDWQTAGQAGVRFNPEGELLLYRYVQRAKTNAQPPTVDWAKWFPADITGLDLNGMELVHGKAIAPPDPSDQVSVWKGTKNTNSIYVVAASYDGKPSYFRRYNQADFDAALRPPAEPPVNRQQMLGLVLGELMLVAGFILAWKNYRAKRSDRKAAMQLASFVLVSGPIVFLLVVDDFRSLLHVEWLLVISLGPAALAWILYTALEPIARSFWPQSLIGWKRLWEGRWNDPIVGRDLLVGVFLGVMKFLVLSLPGAFWNGFGDDNLPGRRTAIETLQNTPQSFAYVIAGIDDAIGGALFIFLALVLTRRLVKRSWVGAILFVGVLTTFRMVSYGHPSLGWVTNGIAMLLFFWVATRFGFLALVFSAFVNTLLYFPITSDSSLWYASRGMTALMLVAAMGVIGFFLLKRGISPVHSR